jgi:hypothetical protein
MGKIFQYTKVTDAYTTYSVQWPYSQEDSGVRELATIGGVTYIYVPDEIVITIPAEITDYAETTLTDELKETIKNASCHVELIRQRVVEKIRQKYTINDEIKLLRIDSGAEVEAYNAYVEECRTWGNVEKAKIGL